MSSSVTVSCHTCGSTLNHGHDSLPGGVGGLFEDLGLPPLNEWNGMKALDMLPRLQFAVSELEDDIQRNWYRARHQKEGDPWDRVEFALPFLRAMRDAICKEPYAMINRV